MRDTLPAVASPPVSLSPIEVRLSTCKCGVYEIGLQVLGGCHLMRTWLDDLKTDADCPSLNSVVQVPRTAALRRFKMDPIEQHTSSANLCDSIKINRTLSKCNLQLARQFFLEPIDTWRRGAKVEMLQRALVKEGVSEEKQQLFRAAGVRHYRQLALRSTWDVAHAVDLSVREVEVHTSMVASHVAECA